MEYKHREELIIPSYLVDGDKLLSPSSIMAVLQELSYNGSIEMGCGVEDLLTKGLAWVFSRNMFRVHRYPRLTEKVQLETWYRGFEGLMVLRDYHILSSDGEPLVSATSSSLIIDINTRELKRTDHLTGVISPEPQCNESALGSNADKLTVRTIELNGNTPGANAGSVNPGRQGIAWADTGITRTVHYGDTDFVGHLNNTCYLKWIIDCERQLGGNSTVPGGLDCHSGAEPLAPGIIHPGEVCINFLKETKLGEELTFRRLCGPDGTLSAALSADGRPSMTCRLRQAV